MSSGRFALLTGSGKDATLALHRCRAKGLNVCTGVSLFDAASGRIAFHGTRVELVEAQHEALGLDAIIRPVGPEGFEHAFLQVLDELEGRDLEGVVLGNIHLADVRAWYEHRITARGFRHIEPLWGERPETLVREVVAAGYRAKIVSIVDDQGDASWLGRDLEGGLVRDIEDAGADPCGENGEYHTFVHDGPEFGHPVRHEAGERVHMRGHSLIDLLPAVRPSGN